MKKSSVIVATIGLLLCASLCGCVYEAPEDSFVKHDPRSAIPPEVTITFDIPNTTLMVGEEFEGRYIANNTGGVFEDYIIINHRKEGIDSVMRMRSWTCRFDNHTRRLLPFSRYNCSHSKGCGGHESTRGFSMPGTYIYEVAVYDCRDIRGVFGYCADVEEDDVATQITPLATAKATVTVIEEAIVPE